MSIQSHSMVSRALTDAARAFDLRPFDVRVLVCLDDLASRGVQRATSDVLEAELHQNDGSNVRRSLIALRPRTMLAGGDKRGTREPIVLLDDGRLVVNVFRDLLAELETGTGPPAQRRDGDGA